MVRKYDSPVGYMNEDERGDYVLTEEYDNLKQRVQYLETHLRLNASMIAKQTDMAKAEASIIFLKDRVKELEADLATSQKKAGIWQEQYYKLEEEFNVQNEKLAKSEIRRDQLEADLKKLKDAVRDHKRFNRTLNSELTEFTGTANDRCLYEVLEELDGNRREGNDEM